MSDVTICIVARFLQEIRLRFPFFKVVVAGACAFLLAACGGGGGGAVPAVSTPSLSGTAAVGAPLPSAVVVLRDAAGNTLTTTADAGGSFTFADTSLVSAPFMLQATGMAGGTTFNLYSLATGTTGVLNVTPATDAITAQALGEDPSTAFSSSDKIGAADSARLQAAKTRLAAALANVYAALGLSTGQVDLMTTAFTADNTGLDKLLDVVSFEVQMQADKPVVVLTNKVAGTGITVDPEATNPAPLPASTELALDVGSINALIASFNTQMATASGIASPAMLDLFTTNFLEEGMDRAAIVEDLKGAVGAKFTGFVLQACESSGSTCHVLIGIKDPDGSEGPDAMVVQRGSDGKWRFHGDQSPFGYSVTPVASARFNVGSTGASTRVSLVPGANLNISSDVLNNGSATYAPSATLQFSFDGGNTWGTAVQFTSTKCPGNDYLSIVNGNASDCGNFFPIPEATAIAANAAMLEGKLKTRVQLFSDDNFTTLVDTHVARVTTRLFTNSAAAQALSRTGVGITGLESDYRSISFAGVGLEFVRVDAVVGTSPAQGVQWQGGVNLLGGKVTMADAQSQCAGSSCATHFGSTARFSSMMLVSRTAQNQTVWAFHALPGFLVH